MNSPSMRSYAAALVELQGMTPVRLAKVLDGFQPDAAWAALAQGRHGGDPTGRFRVGARTTDPTVSGEKYALAEISILIHGADDYPSALVDDRGAPAVLFAKGDPSLVDDGPRVAIVGTRSATAYGRQVASEMGRGLAEAGIGVVSGLALGIDGAAHTGVVRADQGAAPPVAVAGTGLDVVYPANNGSLWSEVARRGVILSEAALGTTPRRGIFPARNRIIAALSDVVVVVECHSGGGSLHTVEAAARRGIPVCAVPGSVRSRSSSGTNGLLVDGCTPVRDVDDVLMAVSLARAGRDSPVPARTSSFVAAKGKRRAIATPKERAVATGNQLNGPQRAVFEAIEDTPTSIELVLTRTGLSVADVATAGDRLTAQGLVHAGAGWWSRR